ncbi:MAG: OmpA family protein [Sulfuricurvum sp.]|uniref:OmpA family protein n=1 Tax=Sulfuricurvum sp. TaxID=2025608 RepID=UPI002602DAA6|nr:OmpA family protein [Sulfuricurvum sp.]MDD5118679.1 OmpA family protein [Sulfuricurvum sp.]
MRLTTVSILCGVMLLSSGCVTTKTHEATLQELENTRNALSSAQKTIQEQQLQIKQNQAEIKRYNDEINALQMKKKELEDEYQKLQGSLGTTRLELGDTQTKLQELQAKLNLTEKQLDTLRQIEAETKKRNEIYSHFVEKLQKMIDAGKLTVSIENGRLVINLPENVLFPTGRTTISTGGTETLKEVADVLKELPDRRFQIEGHTDTVPIHNDRFASNWELSSGRALTVVHLMIDEGVMPQNISAAGYGEYQPRADNNTTEGKALNRRIEIVMLPNLDILSNELPKLPESK